MRRRLALLATALLLAGCTADKPAVPPGDPVITPGPPTTLRVLAGSELADMQPILDEAAKATGVTVKMDFIGSLEGAETVATGKADGKYDAVWFSSDRYLETIPEAKKRLGTATRIMGSPVVLGVRAAAARRLGWTGAVTWKDIAAAAARGDFTFAMTDPASSNTGFSALVEVATALDGTGRALDDAAINRVAAPLTGFFSGQRVTAGSSGWLTDAFTQPGASVDALVTYEASLVELNRSGKLSEPLTVVYPAEGVVSADYPLTLLTGASTVARDAHELLGDYLRGSAVQQRIGAATARRPGVPGVALPAGLPVTPVELPFPSTRPAIEGLLTAYQDRLRRPSRTVYVLDVSGSMKGPRIAALKTALSGLTGVNTSLTGTYCRFRSREEVTLLPFSDRPKAPITVTVDAGNPQPSRDELRTAVNQLKVGGNTAVYDSLVEAYRRLDTATDKDRFVSIVLMTDGESNRGKDLAAFKKYLTARGSAQHVAVFPIMLGEAAESQMKQIATSTGGAVWDARNADLTKAFCQIRGYQ
ncbi:VWA domain-containing protein [Actinoplanes sp. L3-i22]|uniref:substrate-binding and vWA domain-containing protein n=1 Tax=Actinoplanes sp. L3-i22 TaxID=2836373 RepID=UPI001C783B0B|nr:VWA domain-containing protein [Actinoplanes sp. L3-i22]BCY07021.1 VWA domain-containing protein [Actinoplanes sp. L3-i22]